MIKDVFKQIGGFYNSCIFYIYTDSLYIHKKHGSSLIDNRFLGKCLGLGKNDYRNSGIFYAWFLAPKKKYCLMIDHFGVIRLNAHSRVIAENTD